MNKQLTSTKRAVLTALLALLTLSGWAQQGISYQAALRGPDGQPLANREVRLRLALADGGTTVYREDQTATTSPLGLLQVAMGEGAPVQGTYADIDWSRPLTLHVEVDADGQGYVALEGTPLRAVPQAHHAHQATALRAGSERGAVVSAPAALPADSALFEVRNHRGQVVFAVYDDGARVYVDAEGSRSPRGGFAVAGRLGRAGETHDLLVVTPDSTRVYVGNEGSRSPRGGFAVAGRLGRAGGANDLLVVTPDSTRVYVEGEGSRSPRGGFAVAGRLGRAGGASDMLVVTPSNTSVYVDTAGARSPRGGFAVAGRLGRAGESKYMDITRDNYIIGHGAGKQLMGGTSTGKHNSIMGTDAAPQMEGSSNVAIGHKAGNAVTTGDYNVFVGANSARLSKKTSQTVAIGYQAGEGSKTSDFTNGVFVGYQAGYSNWTGNDNVFVGSMAGKLNTTGANNVMMGNGAGQKNVSGANNVFVGNQAGAANTWADNNVFMGYYAGKTNTTGNNNVFVGYSAGEANTTASNNVFMGYNAGKGNTTGHSNVYIGNNAGAANPSGGGNVMIGLDAGKNATGANNVIIGNQAGQNNTANNNIYIGSLAGSSNTSGQCNIFMGYEAGKFYKGTSNDYNKTGCIFIGDGAGNGNGNTATGLYNTMLGYYAGFQHKSGGMNTFIGCTAGRNNEDGVGNVFIGYDAGCNEKGSNLLYISNSSTSTPLIWGDFSAKVVKVNGSQVSTSDQRFKENIKTLNGSLQKITSIRGVSFTWKTNDEINKIKGIQTDSIDNSRLQEGTQLGVIAQEVEKVLPELVHTDEGGFKSVDYTKLAPVLIEAIKELKAEKDNLQQQVDELKQLVEQLLKSR